MHETQKTQFDVTLRRLVNGQLRARSTVLSLVTRTHHVTLRVGELWRRCVQCIGTPAFLSILHAGPSVPLCLTARDAQLSAHAGGVDEAISRKSSLVCRLAVTALQFERTDRRDQLGRNIGRVVVD